MSQHEPGHARGDAPGHAPAEAPTPKITEKPRVEEHYIFALLALPVFAVTVLIVVLIATIGTK
ncbi:MAG TPA: hypothetical protein VM052_01990 [Candidatus Limnocylindrales bacterium]|nr:hypothetical protein [Candidatus Limnocylindrales bacterium]